MKKEIWVANRIGKSDITRRLLRKKEDGYVVEIEPGVWLAPWKGDPGRTLLKSSAKKYKSVRAAERAISKARKYRPFNKALIFVAW